MKTGASRCGSVWLMKLVEAMRGGGRQNQASIQVGVITRAFRQGKNMDRQKDENPSQPIFLPVHIFAFISWQKAGPHLNRYAHSWILAVIRVEN